MHASVDRLPDGYYRTTRFVLQPLQIADEQSTSFIYGMNLNVWS